MRSARNLWLTICLIFFVLLSLIILFDSPIHEYEINKLPDVSFEYSKNGLLSIVSQNSFVELIGEDNIALVIETNKQMDSKDINVSKDSSQKFVDEKIRQHRDNLIKFYQEDNKFFLNSLKWIEYEDAYAGRYSPYVCIKINNGGQFLQSGIIEKLKTKEWIKKITIVGQDEYVFNSTIADYDDSPDYYFSDALEDCGVDGSYDGTGINIGILDLGIADYSNTDFGGRMVANTGDWDYDSLDDSCTHATVCSIIAASNYGVASNANIYSNAIPAVLSSYFLAYEIEWLLDRNVNVINMSWGGNSSQSYTLDDAIIDYFVRDALVSIVVAAGNNGGSFHSQTGEIMHPALAYNAITVGAIDANLDIAEFSSTVSSNSRKVTLVAPGVKLRNISPNCPYMDDSLYTNSGTSFAAPIVTGIVALLMEDTPALKTNPQAIISMLVSSARQYGMSGVWDSYEGGGIVNFANATVSSLSCSNYSLSVDNVGNVIAQQTIIVLRNQDIRVSIAWLINSSTANFNYGYDESILTDFDVKVYNSNDVLVNSCINSYSNIEVINFNSGSGSLIKTFTIKVFQVSARSSNNVKVDIGSISHCYITT